MCSEEEATSTRCWFSKCGGGTLCGLRWLIALLFFLWAGWEHLPLCSSKYMTACQDYPGCLWSILLFFSMGSHHISSRMLPGMLVRYGCCLRGPLYHSLHLGFPRGSNRKTLHHSCPPCAGLSTHLWDFGMPTCQVIFNNDSSCTCLFLTDGKAA